MVAASYLWRRTAAASPQPSRILATQLTIEEHNLNSKIWNNGYGNRNCNVQWRKVVFLGTRRSSLETANGPRQRCGSFSATCEMEDFLIKLKYHAPFDPISVFQYKLCLNKFPKGQQKDIQCCCFVEYLSLSLLLSWWSLWSLVMMYLQQRWPPSWLGGPISTVTCCKAPGINHTHSNMCAKGRFKNAWGSV